jgi:hypothetical protein
VGTQGTSSPENHPDLSTDGPVRLHHVVSEDAVEAAAAQERQPVDALLLVVPQRAIEDDLTRHYT